jgi:hypothetical protein
VSFAESLSLHFVDISASSHLFFDSGGIFRSGARTERIVRRSCLPKATCDNQFEANLMNVCRAAFPEHFDGSNSHPARFLGAPLTCNEWASQALSCEDWVENYAALPRAVGGPWYEDAQVRHCTCCP